MLIVKPSGQSANLMLLVFALTVITVPVDITSGSLLALAIDFVFIIWTLLWFDRNVHIVLDQNKADYIMEEYAEC